MCEEMTSLTALSHLFPRPSKKKKSKMLLVKYKIKSVMAAYTSICSVVHEDNF